MKKLFPYERYHFMSDYLFDNLPDSVLQILMAHKQVKKYKKGQIIFDEGSYAHGIHYVVNGMVKKYTLGTQGNEHIFYLCKAHELLGYHALLSEEPYPDSTEALTDSEIAFIPKADFLAALDKSHLFCQRLLRTLSHEFGVFILNSKILSQHTVRERTAISLLIVEEKFSQNDSKHSQIEIKLSRRDLAGIIGTSIETLVRILHDFKEDGYIDIISRSIYIKDRNALIKTSNYF